jgi:NAD(P)-dependent dehydrogenase (short-subunit alcohol dehydrogenase family)
MDYKKIYDLEGKTVLITGAGGGIGRTLAIGLADFGCDIAAVDKDETHRDELIQAIQDRGRKCLFLPGDVARGESIRKIVEEAEGQFHKIDILINNAGMNVRKPALEYTDREWDQILDTNLKGAFLTSQAVGRKMIERKAGKIINIASIMGLVGSPIYQAITPYCASKGGVVQLTKALALEWAPYNIHVNAIAPGYVKTPIVKHLTSDPVKYETVISKIPLGRFAQTEDLIGPAVFLASDASNYVTGHILFVDGGWLAQ